jgi:hypothetical protein
MHRTEHRDRQCRALRLSAPLRLFSPVTGLTLPDAPQAAIDLDRSLVTAFRSPATGAPFRSFHPEVNVPGLLLRVLPPAYTARSDLRSTTESGWPRTDGCFFAQIPLQCLRALRLVASPIPAPPWDSYLPQDHSQNRLSRQSARLPNPLDDVHLFLEGQTFVGNMTKGRKLAETLGYLDCQEEKVELEGADLMHYWLAMYNVTVTPLPPAVYVFRVMEDPPEWLSSTMTI